MLNLRDKEPTEPELTTAEIPDPAFEKTAAAKAKPKAAKPKPVSKPVSKPANNAVCVSKVDKYILSLKVKRTGHKMEICSYARKSLVSIKKIRCILP